jgi:ribonucleoside-triphosphate reductase
MDYFVQPIFNCCLVNIKDMFENGTVMNGKLVETPKSFQVACTVMTQIIASVASSQYGGQSVNIKHLGKYLYNTKQKYLKKYKETCPELSDEEIQKLVNIRVKDELSSGIQTIQYQINTLMTTNGQSPFVTLFLELDEKDPYIEETAEIIEELFKQRIQGIKNEVGVYVTPAFPKLVYVLDEHNCLK